MFKKLSIPKNIKKNPFDVDVEGSLNIYNKKINFNKIKLKDDYLANKEDKQYFKDAFEKILYDEDFFNIFKIDKIKSFFIAVIWSYSGFVIFIGLIILSYSFSLISPALMTSFFNVVPFLWAVFAI